MYRSLLALIGLLSVPSFASALWIQSPYGNAQTSVVIGQRADGNILFSIKRVSDGDCSLQAVAPGVQVDYWAGAATDAILVVPAGVTWPACNGATLSQYPAPFAGFSLTVHGQGGADVILAGAGVWARGDSENDIILNYGGTSSGDYHNDTLIAATTTSTLSGGYGTDLFCAQGLTIGYMDGGPDNDKRVGPQALQSYSIEGFGAQSDCDFAIWIAFMYLGA